MSKDGPSPHRRPADRALQDRRTARIGRFPAWQGSLFIGGLGSTNLVRLSIKGEQVVGEERLLLVTDSAKGRILKLVPKS
jgi:glucose/arabinose dehydrogenase